MRFFGQGKAPELSGDEFQQIEREYQAANKLTEGPGWEWFTKQMIDRANEIVAMWRAGGHDLVKHESLAAELRTIDKMLTLPELKRADYEAAVTDLKEAERHTVKDDPMSPMPDINPLDDLGV